MIGNDKNTLKELKAEIKKMTDNEIKMALGNCNENGSCSNCPYDRVRFETEQDCASEMASDALNLINRYEAEIERLQDYNKT